MTNVGYLIRDTRRAAGITQAELAGRLGVSQPAVSALEKASSNVSVRTLARALAAMGQAPQITTVPLPTVDEQQIRDHLRLTPGQRLQRFEASQHRVSALRASARRA